MKTITPEKIERLQEILSCGSRFAIVSHFHPDGDALGSTVALCRFLTDRMGKQARVIVPSATETLSFLTEGENVMVYSDSAQLAESYLNSCDVLFVLDANQFSRMDAMQSCLESFVGTKVLVDHHLNPDADKFDLVFSQVETSSTCELLYRVLLALPGVGKAVNLPERSRFALMTGMTTDTNNFANSVFPGTLEMASELLGAGTDRDLILSLLYNNYRRNRVQACSYFLSKKLVICDNGFAYMVITAPERKEFDLRDGETEGLVNVPLSISEVKISGLFTQDNGYFRVSLRSKKGWSANAMAREFFNGGGHEQAAGGRLYFPENIPDPSLISEYVEKVAARFLQNTTAGNE